MVGSVLSVANLLRVLVRLLLSTIVALGLLHAVSLPLAWPKEPLPVEPEITSRVDELYDHEARLFIMLFSLGGDGKIDYVTGRLVQEHARSAYGNPVYQTEAQPLFYWWNHTMWNDPEQDGVNGNEKVYQEGIDFDFSRYKPCLFNGQPC
jgi:hypothetical protein